MAPHGPEKAAAAPAGRGDGQRCPRSWPAGHTCSQRSRLCSRVVSVKKGNEPLGQRKAEVGRGPWVTRQGHTEPAALTGAIIQGWRLTASLGNLTHRCSPIFTGKNCFLVFSVSLLCVSLCPVAQHLLWNWPCKPQANLSSFPHFKPSCISLKHICLLSKHECAFSEFTPYRICL